MTDQNPDGKLPPDAILMQMLFGALIQKSICVAVKIGIPDLLSEKNRTAEELADETDTHAPSLYRVMRALTGIGIFSQASDQTFGLTDLSKLLRSDAPGSLRDFAIMMGEDWLWQAWGELMYSVRTGGVAHDKIQGMSSFEFFTKNKEAGKVFNRAMTNFSLSVLPAIVEAYDFSAMQKLVDVAGGHGILLAGILKANPHLQGVLFDLPSVIEGASELLEKEGVRDRTELAEGDFFQSVPPGANAYMMKHIIHDWDDERSIRILQTIRAAMGQKGKVLIIEMVVPNSNEPSPSHSLDLMMLVMEGGKERTKQEYEKLLEDAGLRLTSIIPTRSPYSIIEAEPQ